MASHFGINLYAGPAFRWKIPGISGAALHWTPLGGACNSRSGSAWKVPEWQACPGCI